MKMSKAMTFLGALAVALAVPLRAQDPAGQTAPNLSDQGVKTAQAQGLKIAFLNFSQILEGTEESKVEISKVRTFMDQKQSAYDQQASELQKLKDQFAAQERTLNSETRIEMQRTIQEKDRGLRRFQEDTQSEINSKRDELFGRLSKKIRTILSEYAQQHSYSAIFFVDQLQGYFNPAMDVTQEIIRIYNERYPVGATSNP
ncbi:MAG: OmpH family outer membrane protein [Acidobacteriota bacterium]